MLTDNDSSKHAGYPDQLHQYVCLTFCLFTEEKLQLPPLGCITQQTNQVAVLTHVCPDLYDIPRTL